MVIGWLEHLHNVAQPALLVAPRTFLADIRSACVANGVSAAVANHDSAPIFNKLLRTLNYQGISDAAADAFTRKHGAVCWDQIEASLKQEKLCPRLQSYWSFVDCGFKKSAHTCSNPELMPSCSLPRLPLRKGVLNQAAFSLFLFMRDVCENDLVSWLDEQLEMADRDYDGLDRLLKMRAAVLNPFRNVFGVSDKILSMAMADLLLGADPKRALWVETGAGMIAIDTLVHNFLYRTGVLHRAYFEHPYGPLCYKRGSCSDILQVYAQSVDARAFSPSFPQCFPRFVQHAIWRFCAQGAMDVCNGNRIDDEDRCDNFQCPNFELCDRVLIRAQ